MKAFDLADLDLGDYICEVYTWIKHLCDLQVFYLGLLVNLYGHYPVPCTRVPKTHFRELYRRYPKRQDKYDPTYVSYKTAILAKHHLYSCHSGPLREGLSYTHLV